MNNGALWPYMPSRLIQANERNYPKQAISAVGANEQRPTAGIVVMANGSAMTATRLWIRHRMKIETRVSRFLKDIPL